MAVPNRTTIINKLYKVLKKHFKPFKPAEMAVVDTLIYACCLENAFPDAAEAAFQSLKDVTFDLNELRVTGTGELAQVMKLLPHPRRAAHNLKRALQSVFESQYSYDLEHLRKQKLGQSAQLLQKYEGTTPFVVNFVLQHSLGGHAIPVDRGTLECLYIVGVISEQEKKDWATPGLERAIPKNRGFEFASLLHQLGAELTARPFGPTAKNILLEISPDAKDRFPKRSARKKKEEEPPPEPEPAAPPTSRKSSKAKAAPDPAATTKSGKQPKTAGDKPASKATPKPAPQSPARKIKSEKPKSAGKKEKPVAKKPAKSKSKLKESKKITRRKPK